MKKILGATYENLPFLPVLAWVVALALAIWMVIALAQKMAH
jgi:hypothetical protein